jgi:hypothetical protein
MRIFPELEKGVLNHVFGGFAVLQITKSEPVIALGVAAYQFGKRRVAALLNQSEEFVVVFIRPGYRHSVELTALRL